MNIQINEKWRIASDPYNFILQQSHIGNGEKNKGDVIWDTVGFFISIPAALNRLLKEEMLQSDVNSLKELKELVRDVQTTLDIVADELTVTL